MYTCTVAGCPAYTVLPGTLYPCIKVVSLKLFHSQTFLHLDPLQLIQLNIIWYYMSYMKAHNCR